MYKFILLSLVAGIGLRFYGLGAKSLWYDEAVSSSFLNFTPLDVLRRSAEARGVHPPLYFLALHPWAALWGRSEFALRSLAAVCGVATIAGMYFLVRELLRLSQERLPASEVPLLAAALVALSPLQILLSQQVRGYTLATALLVWGGWALVRALRSSHGAGGMGWVMASLLTLGACYTHHLALLSVVAQGLFAAALLWHRGRTRALRAGASSHGPWEGGPGTAPDPVSPVRDKGPLSNWVLAALAVFAIGYLIPWLPKLVAQSATIRHDDFLPIRPEHIPNHLTRALFATFDNHRLDPGIGGWLITGLLVGAFAILTVRGGWSGWYLVMTGLLPPLIMATYSCFSNRSIFGVRYLCFAQLSWLAGIALLIGRVPFRFERNILAVLALAWSCWACSENWTTIGPTANPGMRAATRFILQNRMRDEPIIAQTPFVFFGLTHYAQRETEPFLCVKKVKLEAQFASEHLRENDLITIPKLLTSDLPGIWLVSSASYNPSQIARFEVPAHWRLVGSWMFEQDYSLERPINVKHYQIGDGDSVGDRR